MIIRAAVFQGILHNGETGNDHESGLFHFEKRGYWHYVAASRNRVGIGLGKLDFTGNGASVGGMGYHYAKRIAQQQTLGQAIWDTKEALGLWLKNYYVYNLYGDPSTTVMPAEPDFIGQPDRWTLL